MILLKGMGVTAILLGLAFGIGEEHVWVSADEHGKKPTHIKALLHRSDGPVEVVVNGNILEIDFDQFKDGESQFFELENGTELEAVRDGETLVLNMEGKEFKIDMGDKPGGTIAINGSNHGSHIMQWHDHGDDHEDNQVMIQGLNDADEELKEKIRALLQDAGIEKDIQFVNRKRIFKFHKGASEEWEDSLEEVLENLNLDFHFSTHEDDEDRQVKIKIGGGGSAIFLKQIDADKQKKQPQQDLQ